MRNKKLFVSLSTLTISLIFFFSFHVALAKADDLIIQDDGKVVLVITNNDGVLGVSAAKGAPSAPAHNKPPENQNKPQTPSQAVSLVPAHTESTVHMAPPINNDKRIQVTVTTGTTQAAPLPAAAKKPSTTTNTITTQQATRNTNALPGAPTTVITKTVDQVVAQGANGQPVLSITSKQANQLTIQQGTTQASTALPLQIDTLSHSLSISPTPSEPAGSARVSVLPAEALKGASDKGLLDKTDINQTKITLIKDTNGINYVLQNERKGKLFGTFQLTSPVQIKLSAQNGKVITTSQSIFFNLFGGLIK